MDTINLQGSLYDQKEGKRVGVRGRYGKGSRGQGDVAAGFEGEERAMSQGMPSNCPKLEMARKYILSWKL